MSLQLTYTLKEKEAEQIQEEYDLSLTEIRGWLREKIDETIQDLLPADGDTS